MSTPSQRGARPPFLMATCQVGAEGALKAELARDWPGMRLAFSRPGFLTFKLPPGITLAPDFALGSVFARSHALSLGQVEPGPPEVMAKRVWELVGGLSIERLHVWSRDRSAPGYRGYEPGPTAEAALAREAIAAARPKELPPLDLAVAPARKGQVILDCVLVAADQWWIGWHAARGWRSCLAGGMRTLELPGHAVSRAYLKMIDALDWSGLPCAAGQRAAEIGCAPGGGSQALLDRGLEVLGIDPAAAAPVLREHPRFRQLIKRGHEVRRREFRRIRWLLADLNVAPAYTLDTVEAIVCHPEVRIRGMILTLKLLDWSLAAEIPQYLARVRGWGYRQVRAAQLQHHRREFALAALESPPRRGASASSRGRRPRD